MRGSKVCAWAAAALLATFGAPALAADADVFDAFAQELVRTQSIPGMAIAVIHDRKVVKLQGYGFADMAAGRAMTPDTPMMIASISKPILGIQILRLADRSRLDLDADVNHYLPFRLDNPKLADETITLRHLATHTSGIVDVDAAGESPVSDRPWPLADYLRSVLTPEGAGPLAGRHFTADVPGTRREYSNIGARVAGAAVEQAAGASLRDLMRREVFRPLGMRRTSWSARDFPAGELALRYEVAPCRPPPCELTPSRLRVEPQNFNTNYPDGGVHSTARDLAALSMALLNEGRRGRYAMLKPDTFRAMLAPQLERVGESRQRFFWRERDGLVGHQGSDVGVFTGFYFDAARGDGFVVLMNRTPDARTEAAMAELTARLRRTYFQAK